jgi:hypothetical protein
MTANMNEQGVDWTRIAIRLQEEMSKLTHEGGDRRYGNDFYAEALRRVFGYEPAGEHNRETLRSGYGLTTETFHHWDVKGATALSRMQTEAAEKRVQEMRAETQRVYREAGKDLANLLRDRCNERTVPSRYRREGVTWAADMIDPTVPKDRYGNVREVSE